MINRIKDFFVDREAKAADGGERHSVDEYNLAAAALLVHAARIDDAFATIEKRQIFEILRTRFSLDTAETEELMAAAEQREENSIQILGFTKTLKDAFTYDERVGVMEMLWEVVLADGELDVHEDQLMRRIGGLLYIEDRDRGIAKRRARQRLESAKG